MSSIPQTALYYIILMLVGGLVLGLANGFYPTSPLWQLPPLLWLLAVSLLFDIWSNQMAAQGKGEALEMKWRIIGFLAGAGLSILIPWRMGA